MAFQQQHLERVKRVASTLLWQMTVETLEKGYCDVLIFSRGSLFARVPRQKRNRAKSSRGKSNIRYNLSCRDRRDFQLSFKF